jgi:hypothetical protein
MTYIAVVAHENNRVTKYQPFDTEVEALTHVAKYGGFVAEEPSEGGVTDWLVDPVAETLTFSPVPPSREEVNAEADRRSKSGFMFGGKHYQFDDLAKSRITGAAALAHQALTIGGKQATDTKWHNAGGADDPEFTWIASDNSLNVMDAQTVLAFGQTAAAWESAHVFAAKALKDQDPIPADFATTEAYWP